MDTSNPAPLSQDPPKNLTGWWVNNPPSYRRLDGKLHRAPRVVHCYRPRRYARDGDPVKSLCGKMVIDQAAAVAPQEAKTVSFYADGPRSPCPKCARRAMLDSGLCGRYLTSRASWAANVDWFQGTADYRRLTEPERARSSAVPFSSSARPLNSDRTKGDQSRDAKGTARDPGAGKSAGRLKGAGGSRRPLKGERTRKGTSTRQGPRRPRRPR